MIVSYFHCLRVWLQTESAHLSFRASSLFYGGRGKTRSFTIVMDSTICGKYETAVPLYIPKEEHVHVCVQTSRKQWQFWQMLNHHVQPNIVGRMLLHVCMMYILVNVTHTGTSFLKLNPKKNSIYFKWLTDFDLNYSNIKYKRLKKVTIRDIYVRLVPLYLIILPFKNNFPFFHPWV